MCLELLDPHLQGGLVSSAMVPALHPVSLQEFGEQLVRGRNVLSSFPNEVVMLDDVLRGVELLGLADWGVRIFCTFFCAVFFRFFQKCAFLCIFENVPTPFEIIMHT